MMAGERAKALAAKQKAQAKAEKQRRKNSTNPQDWGRMRQLRETYKLTAQQDKMLPWLLLAAGLGTLALFIIIGFLIDAPLMLGLIGISAGLLAAMIVFVQRAKKASFKRYHGQPGSAELALQMLGKKWVYEPVITANRNRNSIDMIHRALGPGGLFLIGEGDSKAMTKLLNSEKRKHEQVAYGVDVEIVHMGDDEGQVPLDKLTNHLKKSPKKLTPSRVAEVQSRLRALDAMRPKLPVPKGHVSMKGARQAMRGR